MYAVQVNPSFSGLPVRHLGFIPYLRSLSFVILLWLYRRVEGANSN